MSERKDETNLVQLCLMTISNKLNVLVIVTSETTQNLSSAFNLFSLEGTVGNSGATPRNHGLSGSDGNSKEALEVEWAFQ